MSIITKDNISEIDIGRIGEHLVCADIISQGYNAYMVEHGAQYDIVMDIETKLLKIQVKTTKSVKINTQRVNYTPHYLFNVRRCGKGGRHKYLDNDIDLIALVALDNITIGYLPIDKTGITMCLRSDEYKGKYQDELKQKRCDEVKDFIAANEGLTFNQMAEKHELSPGGLWAIKNKGFKTIKTGVYLSELTLNKAIEDYRNAI